MRAMSAGLSTFWSNCREIPINNVAPILGSLVNRFMHGEYERGWMKEKDTALYINRGLGVVVLPVRYGSDAEVTVLHMVPATPQSPKKSKRELAA